ncbi:MAG: hypothetical protein BGO13_01110 [Burkholderiales bacterium 66-5]|uniref:DUF2933 domain-containing protein n=1 Tax=unclassified Pseudomonas TaxID=196821 RepID=UPI00072FA2F8|nr:MULTISPECIES: DUF2933 domain-containing protein [unclassified Pseudomonas]KSW27462.1 hypothetical protein AOX63_28260 [Pseudomonas sp. ADP]OBP08918.1 hypothetical protein BAE52_23030 [Pseudomonas sp. EGD-AKN5]OJU87145.1 MAG: hypothetical protein BGO13_01110 [Burkholderiales bacterium 66-5]QOF84130.1 DUF2933 domain-containing protein [Pseudomonas sp. ADPe]
MRHEHTQTSSLRPRFWRSSYGVAFLIIAAVAAYFLLKDHTAHVANYLPLLLLAACPLMHFFMHRGHGHDGHERAADQAKDDASGKADAPGETKQ